jgi:glycosyltransferase involved in cell wall biosynthesis
LRHALFVAFHYPPEASSSGVLRTLKYSRYLAEFGWRVSVITPEISAYTVCDEGLIQQIPRGTRVIRTRYLNTKRHLSIRGVYPALLAVPDVWIGWLPWAVAAGQRVMASDPADVIYSTSPHATAHLIAYWLARRSGKAWVADFRDPWYEDPPEPGTPDGAVFRAANQSLEKLVIGRCDAVVTSTKALGAMLQERYPGKRPSDFHVILNGYDEADFPQVVSHVPRKDPSLRIVHAGNINEQFRDPRPLLAALARLISAGQLAVAELDIQFVGGGPFGSSLKMQSFLGSTPLSSAVSFLPREPYEVSLQRLFTADLLLLLQASDDTVGLVPAKLYEYLRAQRPILALVKTGAVTEILEATGGGWIADPNDPASLDATLAEVIHNWRDNRLAARCASATVLRRFNRRALTSQLAAVFDTVHRRRSP